MNKCGDGYSALDTTSEIDGRPSNVVVCVESASICPKSLGSSQTAKCPSECKDENMYIIGNETACLQECPAKFFKTTEQGKVCILPQECTIRVEDTFECVTKCASEYYLKDGTTCTKTRCEYVTEDRVCTTAEAC